MEPTPDHYEQLRQQLKARRKELHLTQEQLAEALNTSPTHISRVERGQAVPGRDLMILWCKVLEVSLDQTFLTDPGLEPESVRLLQMVQRLDPRKQERFWRLVDLYLRE
ncbi:MAG: helix-turn-helix domain-containing protein [Clostridiales bacterium]|nr:helix-turn-helix domain-containing protein [Clostridiales bacterium]